MRVLSIQSWVVHGHVGNKCAVFPLQLLGHDVDPLLTVLFSNHPMYPNRFKGRAISGQEIDDLLQGLSDNGILEKYDCVLTGYIGNIDSIPVIAKRIKELKSRAGSTKCILIDPVLGDDYKLYVPAGSVELYKTLLCPLADIITPNWFEAELLTGSKIDSMESAILCCDKLHALGPQTVIITSTHTSENRDLINLIASYKSIDSSSQESFKFHIQFPKVGTGSFNGTGDLFAAVLLARLADGFNSCISLTERRDMLANACEKAVATLQEVLTRTEASRVPDQPSEVTELLIVQSADEIRNPPNVHLYKANFIA